jgi:hydrogenase expression/formation protein HypE
MDGVNGNGRSAQVQAIFVRELRNPLLEPLGDSALIAAGRRQLAFTTDSFLGDPPFFPGGDIGELAVNGTINDLAMSGARPVALSAALIIDEGTPLADLERIAASMACASLRAGVPIATGDTKLVERGRGPGVFINTSGVGCADQALALSPARIRAGDRVIVSGATGDHGAAMMIARGELQLDAASGD